MEYLVNSLINWFISMICFLSIYLIHSFFITSEENTLIIAAFGASAILVFSNKVIHHSFSKIFFSSIIASIIGVFWNQTNLDLIFKIALTISTCILILNLLLLNYPPAGAIALIPLISNSEIQNLGYLYVIYPTLTGLVIIYTFSKIKSNILWQVKKQSR